MEVEALIVLSRSVVTCEDEILQLQERRLSEVAVSRMRIMNYSKPSQTSFGSLSMPMISKVSRPLVLLLNFSMTS